MNARKRDPEYAGEVMLSSFVAPAVVACGLGITVRKMCSVQHRSARLAMNRVTFNDFAVFMVSLCNVNTSLYTVTLRRVTTQSTPSTASVTQRTDYPYSCYHCRRSSSFG